MQNKMKGELFSRIGYCILLRVTAVTENGIICLGNAKSACGSNSASMQMQKKRGLHTELY